MKKMCEPLPASTPPLTYALAPGGQLFRQHGNTTETDVFHRCALAGDDEAYPLISLALPTQVESSAAKVRTADA